MAAAHSFLSPNQFEQLYSDEMKPYFEYWFGEAVQKSMPTALHSATAFVVCSLLFKHGWKALQEVRLKISKVAYPVPDVVASPHAIENPYPTKPFELCVEIVSPGDNLPDVFKKCAHYLDWGIGCVWIIDPQRLISYQMTIEKPQPKPVSMSSCFTAGSGEHEICILLSDIFGEMERAGLIDEAR